MKGYIAKRVLIALLAAYLLSFAVFFLAEWGMRNTSYCNPGTLCSEDQLDRLRKVPGLLFLYRGLDKEFPLWVTAGHWRYLAGRVQGEVPTSLSTRLGVDELLLRELPPTLRLVTTAAAFTISMAIPLSIGAALFFSRTGARLVGHRFLVVLCVLVCLAYLTCIQGMLQTPSPTDSSLNPISHTHPLIWPALALALLALPSTVSLFSSLLGAFLHPPAPPATPLSVRWRVMGYQALAFLTRSSPLTILAAHLSWLLLGLLVVERYFLIPGLSRLITWNLRFPDLYVGEPFLMVWGIIVILFYLATDILRGWTERSAWFQAYQDLAERSAVGGHGGWAVER